MDTSNWILRVKKLPHRVFDHPLSGAYAMFTVMANVAAAAISDEKFSAPALLAVVSLGAALTAGRRIFIKNDVLAKLKKQLPKKTNKTLVDENNKRTKCLKKAFDILYTLDSIAATRALVPALHQLLQVESDHQDVINPLWGSKIDKGVLNDEERYVNELVTGALYFAMRQPSLLTGKLSKKLQAYITTNHPTWLAEYPAHFATSCVNSIRPGLIDVAVNVYGLHDTSYERRVALENWVSKQASPEFAFQDEVLAAE